MVNVTNAIGAPAIIPWPKTVSEQPGGITLGTTSRIVISNPELMSLGKVLSDEIMLLTGLKMAIVPAQPRPDDIVLMLDPKMKGEEYSIDIKIKATVKGRDYNAVAIGTATLLQVLTVKNKKVTLPHITVSDSPAFLYRGVMIDVARRYNSIYELKQCVIMCRLYKIRYMHLHLTDDHAWTFPSTAFPKLGSSNRGFNGPAPKVYKLDDLKELVKFADERGVTLVPELDMPGHTDSLRIPYPEIFDSADGPAHMGLLNMANEKAYAGLETIMREMMDVFKSSPYFHIGADEARLDRAKVATNFYKPYLEKHGLESTYDLYIHFIDRMNTVVKKYGKQTIVWGDFHGTGTKNVKVPKDVIAMAWRNGSKAPADFVKNGYEVINATWNPLYVVNQKTNSVTIVEDGRGKHKPETIYTWNVREFDTTVLDTTDKLLGAQMCAWEQGGEIQIPSLRSRVPAMGERIWNPSAGKDFADFKGRYNKINPLLDTLIKPYR